MKYQWIGFAISIILTLGSFYSFWARGLNFGIDFTGGILMEVKFTQTPDLAKMRHMLTELKRGEISLQSFGTDNVMIRVGDPSNDLQTPTVDLIKGKIDQNFANLKPEYRKVDYVGPQVGAELIKNGVYATVFSFLAIMLYIWLRFEWQYGIGLVLALIHDVIISLGFLSIIGLEFNLASIAAILTIVGYSVNDSVVIYDRIRENMRKYKRLEFNELINISINDTLSRTILTVVTTLLATLALIIFGGEAIKSFSIVVFFGIIAGTYSSIVVSAPILTYLGLAKKNNNYSK
jgi:preprotein translocase subunit SecF